MIRPLFRILPAFVLLASFASYARAETLPEFRLPSLVTSAVTIVVAIPKGDTWKVQKVLQGAGLKEGDTVPSSPLCPIPFTVPVDPFRNRAGGKERTIERALVFLDREAADPKKDLAPMLSGIRLAATDGRVLRPVQLMNPGGYDFVPIADTKWEDTLKFVTTLIADSAKVRELKAIPEAGKRNRAILQWLTDHQVEIRNAGPGWNDSLEPIDGVPSPKSPPSPARSWGSLPSELFLTIAETDLAEDVWQAAHLLQDIYPTEYPHGMDRSPAFRTAKGREMLLAIVTDPKAALADRRLAIRLPQIGLFSAADPHKDVDTFNRDRKVFLARMLPLIDDADSDIRGYAFRIIAYACNRRDGYYQEFRSTEALEPLIRRYAVEPPGQAQLELARAIVQVGGPDPWHKLTGNPGGRIGDLSVSDWNPTTRIVQLNFYVEGPFEPQIYAAPTARAERFDAGKVVQTSALAPTFSHLPQPWSAGWGPSHGALQPSLDLTSLRKGTWRIRLEGTLGKAPDTQPWISEPVIVTIE